MALAPLAAGGGGALATEVAGVLGSVGGGAGSVTGNLGAVLVAGGCMVSAGSWACKRRRAASDTEGAVPTVATFNVGDIFAQLQNATNRIPA